MSDLLRQMPAATRKVIEAALRAEDDADFDGAVAILEAALAEDPANDHLQLWLAYALRYLFFEKDVLRRAAAILEGLAQTSPRYRAIALALLAHTLEETDDISAEDEVALLTKALCADPALPRAHCNLARVCWRRCGDSAKARQHVEVLLKLLPAQEAELPDLDRTFRVCMTGEYLERRSLEIEFRELLESPDAPSA